MDFINISFFFRSNCPGRFLAMAELKQYLILMLHRFKIELTDPDCLPGFNMNRTAFAALPPVNDIQVRLRPKTEI